MADDERDLLRRVRALEEEALGTVFDTYYQPLYRYIYHRVGHQETAEDLTADVFNRLLKEIDRGRGLITNTATISHPDLLEEVVVDAAAYIGEGPLLEISKSAWLGEVEEGDRLTYTLHLRNLGLQATDVVITDAIPANTTYVPGSASGDGELVNDRVRWEFLVLDAGDDRTVSFAVAVGEGSEVVNEQYGATCAEDVTTSGLPVVTDIAGGTEVYLPLLLKNWQ